MLNEPLEINGWKIFAHPLFLEQFELLLQQVELLRDRDAQNSRQKNATKRLAAISKLIFEVIPEDPTRNEYRQGATLGDDYKHWFRVKFFQQCRLFFRYHQASKMIVYVWVNDEQSKRADESKTDADLVFKKMLGSGNPPDDWAELLAQADLEFDRLKQVFDDVIDY